MTNAERQKEIEQLLSSDGPIAIVIKQALAPVDDEDPVIFPPTYPINDWKGRVHSIRDGDYRVTVELPAGSKTDKDEKKGNQRPGYQIDRFSAQENICEIDSPQSQSNRIEPRFKVIAGGVLVPQVEISVGSEHINLLDVGHRAGDAIVRMSSLAPEIHDAFIAAKSRDFFKLAMIAPTSLVFGVWDSRSTYVKQQRLFKAFIRATNVQEVSRSAQYTPAVAYVDVGAIGAEIEKKTGDESNLSQEGMLHALSTQSVGGVRLTQTSSLVRTVNVNVEAIRSLTGIAPKSEGEQTLSSSNLAGSEVEQIDSSETLRRYILGLALVAAFDEPCLNLREGCHLRFTAEPKSKVKLIYRSKKDDSCSFTLPDVIAFATKAKDDFFALAKIESGEINRPHETFETGVAEKFLAYSQGDRDKIRRLGPLTLATLTKFATKGNDPFKNVSDELKEVKKVIGAKPRGKSAQPVVNLEAFETILELLEQLGADETLPASAAKLAVTLASVAKSHDDSHHALKDIDDKIKEFKKTLKDSANAELSETQEKE